MKIVEFMWKDKDGKNKVECQTYDEVCEFCKNNTGQSFKVNCYRVMTVWVYEGNGGDCLGPYNSIEEIDGDNLRISKRQRSMIVRDVVGKYPGRFHDVEVE